MATRFRAEQKDHARIANIYGRAVGSLDKVMQLARNMANAITDPAKACRRGDAAWRFAWHGLPANTHEHVARIFYTRAIDLAGQGSVASQDWGDKLLNAGAAAEEPPAAQRPAPAPAPAPATTHNPSHRKIQL